MYGFIPNLAPIRVEPKPLTREDALDMFKTALKDLVKQETKEGVVEGIKKAVDEAFKEFREQIEGKEKEYNLSYNNRTINFCGKQIPVPEDTNYEYLCNVLFKDDESKNKVWPFDEVIELWGYEPDKKSQRKVYTAAKDLNVKVAMKTTIDNLLIVTTKTVQINPHYRQ